MLYRDFFIQFNDYFFYFSRTKDETEMEEDENVRLKK